MNQPTPSPTIVPTLPTTGVQWIIEATNCNVDRLRDVATIDSLCRRVVGDLGLQIIGTPQSHQFPTPGGVTLLYLLAESHLACHTYPEFASATFNLYCCRETADWPWKVDLQTTLSAQHVRVRSIERNIAGERSAATVR